MLKNVFKWLHLQKILGGPRSALPYNQGRVNEDATRGQKGWSQRDRCFVITTPQRYGSISWFDLLRDPQAAVALFVGMAVEGLIGGWISWSTTDWIVIIAAAAAVGWKMTPKFWYIPPLFLAVCGWFSLISVDWIVMKLTFIVVACHLVPRLWYLLPMVWAESARHVFVLYQAAGYWHRAEYIRGKGEVVEVLTDANGPIPVHTSTHELRRMLESHEVNWKDQDEKADPRDVVRIVRTYRRRPTWNLPMMFYGRTSVGFACHILGIRNPMLRTPQELMDYCESDAQWDEYVDTGLKSPEAKGGYG